MDQPRSQPAHAREAVRDSLLLIATVSRFRKRKGYDVRVRNLSALGMMADCTEPFERGEPVTVKLRAIGEVQGTIAWSTPTRIGITFNGEIDPRRARKPAGQKPELPHFLRRPPTGRPPLKT